jgi:KDO2-lipid IV(A) lauroyltransferase
MSSPDPDNVANEAATPADSRLGEIRPPGPRLGVSKFGRRPFLAFVVRTTLRILGALPLRLTHFLGTRAGHLAALVPGDAKHVTDVNLRIAFPEMDASARRRLRHESLKHNGRTMAEMGFLMNRRRDEVLELVRRVHGEELIREAIDAKRGVILGGLHLGSWELVLAYCSSRYPMTTLYRPLRSLELDAWLREQRERFGTRMAMAGPAAAHALMRALKRGEMIGIAPDQDAGEGSGIFVPLFGELANTMILLPRLAAKTGALVVLAYAERLPRGAGCELHFVPAATAIADRDLQVAATALNESIEGCVRSLPEQWLWAYKRYRIRPVGQASPYDGRRTPARPGQLPQPDAAEDRPAS